MDWGDFLTQTGQDLIGSVADSIAPVSAKPVSQTAGGLAYVEGKPAAQVTTNPAAKKIFGLPAMAVYGGAALLAVGAFLMLRK